MKKTIFTAIATLVLATMISVPVYAGDINEAEQRIISAISATYEYEGAYYRVTDAYITKVSNYLNRDDVNLSSGEVDSYLNQFYANIAVGISSGYMECVGKVESEEKPDTPATEEQPGTDSGNNSGNNENNQEQTPSETIVQTTEEATETGNKESVEGDSEETLTSSIEHTEESIVEETTVVETTEGISETEEVTSEEASVEQKDYSGAEPYQQGISVGVIAIAVVIVVAIAMIGILLWHRNKRYRR